MVLFDQLSISDNGKQMLLNFHINQADYFQNIYLKSLTIMTSDQVSETTPLSPSANFIYKKEYAEAATVKADYLVLDKGAFDAAYINWNPSTQEVIDSSKPYANTSFDKSSLSDDLFFVYVECWEAALVGCPPCRLDEPITLGVTFDENLLHQRVLGYTNELVHDCQVPQGFTDFILLWQAFKSSIEAEHPIMAIKYWNMLFDDSSAVTQVYKTGCGCHGKNSL